MSNSHIFVKTVEKQMKRNNQRSLMCLTLGSKADQKIVKLQINCIHCKHRNLNIKQDLFLQKNANKRA